MGDRRGGGSRERSKPSTYRSGKPLSQQEIYVGEELKIAVNAAVDRFRNNEAEKELEFPSSLTANERAYVHRYCQDLGLISKSKGKGNKRFLTIYKVEEENISVKSKFHLTKASDMCIAHLLNNYPVLSRDRHELSGQKLHKGIIAEQSKILAKENRLVLSNMPFVPPQARESEVGKAAQNLPIFSLKEEILKSINSNQVVMITGDTGSGKTTQVGQYILEEHHETKIPCRIICTQPRRISAISVAERVAAERGERIGQTVGYQVRLDSKLSPKTLLHYCTNGVLLRLLMVGHKCLSNITHIIVDEIHERDRFSDYLLISLRDILKTYKKLKIILMSATLNADLFKNYFGTCPSIHVPGECFDVKSYFLEDILKQTGYLNKGMRKMLQDGDMELFANSSQEKSTASADVMELLKDKTSATSDVEESTDKTDEGTSDEVQSTTESKEDIDEGETEEDYGDDVEIESDSEGEKEFEKNEDEESLKGEVSKLNLDDSHDQEEKKEVCEEMDTCLAQAWLNGEDEAFDQIIHLIMNENVPIDYQHSDTMMTALIVAAARGNLILTEQLVELGAKLDILDPKNGRHALDWAKHFNQDNVSEYLQGLMFDNKSGVNETSSESISEELDENDKRRLELYHKSFDDQKVDIGLILALLRHICKDDSEENQGAILVFLPGYDEIISLRDRLFNDKEFGKRSDYQILMLHSMLPPSNQRRIFMKPPKGVRKIILSTNIAETSVTIEDIVFVIDSGKVKEKSHDAVSSVSTLRTVWISKASAVQRKGRAGRCMPGVCYHLFSQERFHHFSAYQDAEILRVPLYELCLQTKMLAPVNISISNYLAKAPEPPSNLMIRNAVRVLKSISALDENEDMTDLGKLLVEFPIDPQNGKMILMGMTLKCLEPAIIIACCSSYKEPFLLPTIASQKSQANVVKLRFSSDSLSDHIAMLRAFQGWQHAKREGREKLFCYKNFISPGTMEIVSGLRRQILVQLKNLGLVRSRGPGNIKDLNSNSKNWAVIKAVVGAALYPNLVKVDRDSLLLVSEKEKKVNIHNSSVVIARNEDKVQSTVSRANKMKSVLKSIPFDWLAYEELSRLYYSVQIRSVTALSPVATALVAGPCLSYEHSCLRLRSSRERKGKRNDRNKEMLFQESDSEQEERNDADASATFKIDDWISFTGDDAALYSIAMLRIKFLALFSKHIQIPGKTWSVADDAIVQCIANVLTKEEQAVGITNPATRDVEKRLAYERKAERYAQRDGYDGRGYGYSRDEYSRRGPHPNYRGSPRHERYQHYHSRDEKDSDSQSDIINEHEDQGKTRGGDHGNCELSYFIMKCNNERNMAIAFERSIWATTKGNEKRLRSAYSKSDEVILIFSIQGSGHFQGVAKMTSAISDEKCDDFGSANLGGVFEIEWMYKDEVPFQYTQHLTNPWNDNKKVQISRDAQEVEPSVGESLVQIWEHSNESRKEQHTPDPETPEKKEEESPSNDFYPEPLYEETDPGYMESYPLYSPPPFSHQFLPEFVPQHHFAPPPPPPHMAYQQPYPSYPPHEQMSPYRQQFYYPMAPQYPSPRRGPHEVYNRNGAYSRHPQEMRSRGGGFRS